MQMVHLLTTQPPLIMFSIKMLMLCKTHYKFKLKLNLVLHKRKTENCVISDYFFGFSLNHN